MMSSTIVRRDRQVLYVKFYMARGGSEGLSMSATSLRMAKGRVEDRVGDDELHIQKNVKVWCQRY
jgi:hypothetical protein